MFWKIFRKETVAAVLSGVHLRVLRGRLTWVLSQDTGTLRLLGPCADPVGRGMVGHLASLEKVLAGGVAGTHSHLRNSRSGGRNSAF